jgi:hypothetical protein
MNTPTRWRRLHQRISNPYVRVGKRDTHASQHAWRLRPRARWLVGGAALLLVTARWAAAGPPHGDARMKRVQRVVDAVRTALEIEAPVLVQLVEENPRVASVQPVEGRAGVFLLSVQEDFLEQLADDELEAMVAHELGHVWIFTHHPYLQTEQLANRVAMRHVTREQLERVYVKVWGASGYKQELAEFLGVAAASPRQIGEAGGMVAEEVAPAGTLAPDGQRRP